jgi:hypothetical protein
VYKNWSHVTNPSAKQKPTIQKFWKNNDKKVEIMMNTTQKIPFHLDQK